MSFNFLNRMHRRLVHLKPILVIDKKTFSSSPFDIKSLNTQPQEIRETLIKSANKELNKKRTLLSFFRVAANKNHLFNFKEHLSKKQLDYVTKIDSSCHQLILDEHLSILKTFYDAKKRDDSLLGQHYRQLSFEQMIQRFIQNRYRVAYQDGRLLSYKEDTQKDQDVSDTVANRHNLMVVGTKDDTIALYKDYLSLEESALAHLVFANSYFLPISNAHRPLNNRIMTENQQKKIVIAELEKSHVEPVLINYVVGPELRNGQSLHFDALMCLEFDSETPDHEYYDRRMKALSAPGFSNIAQALYGDEHPLCEKTRQDCDVIEFELKGGSFQSEKVYFYVNAYRNRMRHTLKQVLIANDVCLADAATVRLKGLGLGAFGIHALSDELETIFIEVLNDLISELALTKIKKIELLNFPSFMRRHDRGEGDLDYYLEHTAGIRAPVPGISSRSIEVVHLLAPSLNYAQGEALSTQICGDSISLPGNEALIGMPPSSSDEATMYYALGGLNAFNQQAKFDLVALMEKVIITDGKQTKNLRGDKINLVSFAINDIDLKTPTVIKSKKLSSTEAIEVMDTCNAIKGVSASIEGAGGGYTTSAYLVPDFDRDKFLNAFQAKENTPKIIIEEDCQYSLNS